MRSPSELGKELDQLAKLPACNGLAAPLKQLAQDLRNGTAQRWAGIDILRVLEPEAVVVVSRPARLGLFELFRTLVLFLPLLFTWIGIFFAVQAYRGLLNAAAEEQQKYKDASFLQMWTGGFGGRTWVTLDVVALADFLAILLVVVMFGFGGLLQRRAKHGDDVARQAIVKRLRAAAAESSLAVGELAEHRPEPVLRELRDLAPALRDTVRGLVLAQQELVASMEAGKSSAAALVTATDGLAVAAGTIGERVGDLAVHLKSVSTTAERFDDTAGSLAGVMQDVTAQLHEHLRVAGQLNDQMGRLHDQQVRSLDGLVPLYEQTLQRLGDAQSQMVATVDVGQRHVADLARATGDMASAGSAVAGSAAGLKTSIASITAATGTFDRSLQSLLAGATDINLRLPSLKQDLVEVLAAIKGISGKLDRVYDHQEMITQNLGHLADVPTAAAAAAKRTARLAADTEAALQLTLSTLPGQIQQLCDGMLAALDRELVERRAAADAVSGASEAARQMVAAAERVMRDQVELSGRAARQLTQSSQDATTKLINAIDRLGRVRTLSVPHSRGAAAPPPVPPPDPRPRLFGRLFGPRRSTE